MYCQVSFSTGFPKRLLNISLRGMYTEPKLILITKHNSSIAVSTTKATRYVFLFGNYFSGLKK